MDPAQAERAALLERAEELTAVDAAIADSRLGSGRFVVIEGPAGIGKSSLLAEGQSRAADAEMSVATARGSELESAFSYGLVRQLYEPMLVRTDASDSARLFEGAAVHARRLFDPEQLVDQAAASDDAAFAMLHGLYWLTVNIAESRPLLIAIDDLQWADAASLKWIGYLAGRLDGVTVGVLAAVRPLEVDDPLIASLLVDPATTVVRPGALSAPAVAEVVRDGLSPNAEVAFCLACHRATNGNPLLLRELVRTLAAEGVSPTAESVGLVERLAPDAVSRSVRLRLSRLPGDAATLARAVAVLGDGADGTHVAAFAGLGPGAVGAAAAALARVNLFAPDPPLRFVHPVVRNAVYEGIAAHKRAHEHARAATTLSSASAPLEQIAAQLLLAPPGSLEEASAKLREAARRAAGEAAPESAARYLRRALEEPLEDGERGELLLQLAGAEFQLGTPSLVDHLSEAAEITREPARRVQTRLELARALFLSAREHDALTLLEQMISEADPADDEFRRRLEAELITNALRLPGRHAEAAARLKSAIVEPADTSGKRVLLSLRLYVDTLQGHDRDGVVARGERIFSAQREEEGPGIYWALVSLNWAYSLVWADAYEAAVRFVDAMIADARRTGAVFLFSGASVVRAMASHHSGALAEAEADARAAFDALPHRRVVFMPQVYGWLAQTLIERGALDEAADLLRQSEIAETPAPETFFAAPVVRARAALHAARGDARKALAHSLAYGRAFVSTGLVNPAAGSWRSDAALAHVALGERDQALPLVQEELRLAQEWGAPRAIGRALRGLGLVEGGERGIELLREAAAVLECSASRLEYARAAADLGGALRRANRRAEAREPLRTSLEAAQRCGAQLLAERAHEELIATGARPRRLAMSGIEALTPSERRVAAMAAEGMTNREIAQALFVTLRTVEMHLSNGFRKLSISTRTQLPAALTAAPTPAAAARSTPAD